MSPPSRQLLPLVGASALALSPHLLAQPLWLAGILGLLLSWRAWLCFSPRALPPRWLLFGITLLCILLVFFAQRTLIGPTGGTALLATLVILKLFEARGQERDNQLLLLLGYFCTGSMFLSSQSLPTLGLALLSTLALTACALQLSSAPQPWRSHCALAGRMMLEALPVAMLLFVLFPRLPGPLWQMPQERTARTGLSAEWMEPGQVSRLALDESVAFRVQFEELPPRHNLLYWRGPVFEHFDGRRWRPSLQPGLPPRITPMSRPVRYQVTLEPHQQFWLLALDVPTLLPPGAMLSSRLQAVAPIPIRQRHRYSLASVLDWQIDEDPTYTLATRLPASGNPRARELAAGWQALPPEQRIRSALDYLRRNGFVYTLEPPLLRTTDSIDEFLFESRQGFCEHFAGAFAFLMRAAGVPARVVTGYQGGELNAAGGYLIVRQSDAHAWTEIWLDGEGWQRIDPTASAAPDRIELGLAQSLPQNERLLLRDGLGWFKGTRLHLDVLVNGWNQWVIGYDAERQRHFLSRLGIEDFLSTRYLAGLVGSIGLLLAGVAVWTLRPFRFRREDPAQRCYRLFCRKLAAHGLHRHPAEGPLDFARRCVAQRPDLAPFIEPFTADYLAVRYGRDQQRLAALRQQLHRL